MGAFKRAKDSISAKEVQKLSETEVPADLQDQSEVAFQMSSGAANLCKLDKAEILRKIVSGDWTELK